jgi:hypothetical protein
MDFEEIAAALVEDGDIKRKVKATECLIQFLVEQIPSDREFSFANTAVSTIDLAAGTEMNIVCLTVCVELVNDANSKLALLAFDCVQLIIDRHGELFRPHVNHLFDILVLRFTDNKVTSCNLKSKL